MKVSLFARAAIGALLLSPLAPVALIAPANATDTSDPTVNGPYSVTKTTVSDSATPGFGAATIYTPQGATGLRGGVAIAPGFSESQSGVAWFGPRLASHGFVVITFNTQSYFDQPPARGTQLLAALDYLTGTSVARTVVDPSRLAVMGHSMGGGGTLEAAKARPSLKAAIPLTPWSTDKDFPEVTTPTLIIGAQNDTIAPVNTHALPLYRGLTNTPAKAYVEAAGAGHNFTMSNNAVLSTYTVEWLKRFLDGDVAASSYFCPGPLVAGAISAYQSTCPF